MSNVSLGRKLAELEARYFVGREPELDAFRRVISGQSLFRVLNVFGPGGVGKTYLLRAMKREAEAHGVLVLHIDADEFTPSVRAFTEHLWYVLENAGVTDPRKHTSVQDALVALETSFSDVPLLILIDTYEALERFDHWVRESFVSQLPSRATIVIAGRNPLRGAWTASPAWRELLLSVPLESFSRDTSAQYLSLYGIANERLIDTVYSFTKGHPLTLSLAAHMTDVKFGDLPAEAQTDVLLCVAQRWRDNISEPRLQELVEIAAHLHDFNEEKLAYIYAQPIDRALFDELISMSLIKSLKRGWTMHEVIRQAIEADLQRRAPNRSAHIRKCAALYVYEQIAAGARTPENISRFFYYVGDQLIRSVIFGNMDVQSSDYYVDTVTNFQRFTEEWLIASEWAKQQIDDLVHRTQMTFTLPAASATAAFDVTREHNTREVQFLTETNVEAYGRESFHLLQHKNGDRAGTAIVVPIHRETLPVLQSTPVTRAYFASLPAAQLESYQTDSTVARGIFIRSLTFRDANNSQSRSVLLYHLLPLLLSYEHIVASTPLPLYAQLLQRFGFVEVPGATHYDYGPDQPSPTYLLDLSGDRLGAYLQSFISDATPQPADFRQQYDLTEREAEVLKLVLAGETNAAIAQSLYLAEVTVKKHVGSLLKKTGARNRQQLIAQLLG